MACPLFLPTERLAGTPHFNGRCAGDPGVVIPEATLRNGCNPGYARGMCERAARSESDAFRFLVRRRNCETIEVAWSAERDHHPVAVGTLLLHDCASENAQPLECQARAYATRAQF
jgi:hypothetical protein